MPSRQSLRPKRIGRHIADCAASAAVRARKQKTVWMTPQLMDDKLTFVCADAGCAAKLSVLNVLSLRLPKF